MGGDNGAGGAAVPRQRPPLGGGGGGLRLGRLRRTFFALTVAVPIGLLACSVVWLQHENERDASTQRNGNPRSRGPAEEEAPSRATRQQQQPPTPLRRHPLRPRQNRRASNTAVTRALDSFRPGPTPATAAKRSSSSSSLSSLVVGTNGTAASDPLSSAPPFTNYTLPPLEELVDENGTVVGDVQVLLHFAVVGFGKCGTTSFLELLRSHSHLQALQSEVWALSQGNPARLLRRLHSKLPANLPRGYKCPGDVLSTRVLDFYRRHWPQTRLFVGVRSPVWHFQSLYNFRVQNFVDYAAMKPPSELVGACTRDMKMVCTKRGHFGYHLFRLGKHRSSADPNRTSASPLEEELAHWYPDEPWDPAVTDVPPLPNPVFLFDVHQLSDSNETRRAIFRRDVAAYLGVAPEGFRAALTDPLHHFQPGRGGWDAQTQASKDAKKIRICDAQHATVRAELVRQAQASSLWIRQAFLHAPGVSASSRGYLEELLKEWMEDPCDKQQSSEQRE